MSRGPRLTTKNRKELSLLRHYMPEFLKNVEITPADQAIYFDWSDRGMGRAEIESRTWRENNTKQFTGVSALYFAKRNRDLAITSYLQDFGETVTAIDFVDEPREVVEFVARAINKPGILTLWKLFNAKNELSEEDLIRLDPLAALSGYVRV